MSRGPGRWQRTILERLTSREQYYLTEILPYHDGRPGGFCRHEQMAALRAAHRLAAQGRIALDTRRFWTNLLYWTGERWQRLGGTIVARPGVRITRIGLQLRYQVAEDMQWRSLPPRPERAKLATKVPTLKPFQLGAVAGAVKLLASAGHVTDALIVARMAGTFIPEPIILAALDQLKASGAYQRLIQEAAEAQP
jgi:hypothetical protein